MHINEKVLHEIAMKKSLVIAILLIVVIIVLSASILVIFNSLTLQQNPLQHITHTP